MNVIDRIKEQIKNDPMNKSYTNQNIINLLQILEQNSHCWPSTWKDC